MNNCMMIAFIFDSGRLGDTFYGRIVFEHMLMGKEIVCNSRKVVVSTGDISISSNYIDIEPYIIKNEICTIDLDKLNETLPFADFPYCWVIEDIDIYVARNIDKRLKDTLPGYIGITVIDPKSDNECKQFWKKLPRSFAILEKKIIAFQDPELTSAFVFEEFSKELGYDLEYARDVEYMPIENANVKQSSFVTCEADRYINISKRSRSGVERNSMIMNFDLNKELHVAGDFIWKSIVELSQVNFASEYSDIRCIEHSFFVLYNAAQGVERLQKILVELISKKHYIKQDEVEVANRILLGHNHHELNSWISNKEKTNLDGNCIRLFCVLQDFYNKFRYSRYADVIEEDQHNEFELLKSAVVGHSDEDYDLYFKKYIGKILGNISHSYYKMITSICHEIDLYAYEIYPYSTAAIVFYNPKAPNLFVELLNRYNEKKELVYWLLKNRDSYPRFKYLSTPALNIDPGKVDEYISDMIYRPDNCEDLHGEVDACYDEMCSKNKKNWEKHREEVEAIIANSFLCDLE